MTNSEVWKSKLKDMIDELNNRQLHSVMDEVYYMLDAQSTCVTICGQCECANGSCRLDGYGHICPFVTDEGIDDYMNATVEEWDFKKYIDIYLLRKMQGYSMN